MRNTVIYGLFHRITTSGRYIPEIDGLRFLAISAVLLFHFHNYTLVQVGGPTAEDVAGSWAAALFSAGHWGVALFFCLSGFMLSLPFARHHLRGGARVSLRKYYIRRAARIEPPYLIALAVSFTVLYGTGRGELRELLSHLGPSLFYAHSILVDGANPILPVAWSLEIEAQFYVLAPLLTSVYRLPGGFRRALIAGTMLLLPFVQMYMGALPNSILFHLQYFLGGFLVSDLYVGGMPGTGRKSLGWDLAAVGAAASMVALADHSPFTEVLSPWLLPCIIVSSFKGKLLNRFLRIPMAPLVGGMCYSIYLVHFNAISVLGKLVPGQIGGYPSYLLALSLVALPGILLISCIFYITIEKPCMRPGWPRVLFGHMRSGLRRLARAEARREEVIR
jgi:peptidoglycan/LPS O-acetylase OafA/YrhL